VAGSDPIPFNRPYVVGQEFSYIQEAIRRGKLSGNGIFAERCARWLEQRTGASRAFMTPSCTAALEMCATLAEIEPGDEIIMPSFTFVSTANAFVGRGGVPVFVDVRPDTLNVSAEAVEEAVTPRTKAIVVVHYAGVACEMDEIMATAHRHGLLVIEDAAHALLSRTDGRPLGGIGQLGTVSFHETKNVHCGEGGALLVNDPEFVQRAEIVQEKGTNRARFFRGEVDKYTWVDTGSSHLTSEVAAAFLWAQLERAEQLTSGRLAIWHAYHQAFERLEKEGLARRPVTPDGIEHNGHMYHLLLSRRELQMPMIDALKADGVHAVFHYVPLHSSPAGRRYGRTHGDLAVTDDVSARIVRLPLWYGLAEDEIERVIGSVFGALARLSSPDGRPRAASPRPEGTRRDESVRVPLRAPTRTAR
jgi:dTDP-4-amino-4,6-dideoxygalactose transaminase